jgi:hypothetical protein
MITRQIKAQIRKASLRKDERGARTSGIRRTPDFFFHKGKWIPRIPEVELVNRLEAEQGQEDDTEIEVEASLASEFYGDYRQVSDSDDSLGSGG